MAESNTSSFYFIGGGDALPKASDGPAPCSFVAAVWEKFGEDNSSSSGDGIQIFKPKKGPALITDSGHLILPSLVPMDQRGIMAVGHHPDLGIMCAAVQELDLSYNHITSFHEVLHLIGFMPRLTFLNVTSNPLCWGVDSDSVGDKACQGGNQSCMGNGEVEATANDKTNMDPAPTAPAVNNVTPSAENDSTEDSNMNISATSDSEVGDITSSENNSTRESSMNISASCDSEVSDVKPSAENDFTQEINANLSAPSDSKVNDVTPSTENDSTQESKTKVPALNETKGRLQIGSGECSDNYCSTFPTVREVALTDTGIDWPWVVKILTMFPSLETLHLSLNGFSGVHLPPSLHYPSLTHLYFNNNPLTSWSQLCRLGNAFPNLRHLLLADTAIREMDADRRQLEAAFPRLTLLSLSKTQLSGWEQVDRLRDFPSLLDVRLQGIPFLEAEGVEVRRQQLLARLPNIQRLNVGAVTAEERLDAERAFIRLYMDAEQKPDRYYELESQHGKLEPLAQVDLTPKTSVAVTIVYGPDEDRFQEMEIALNQTVRDLRKLLQNFAGLPSAKFDLYHQAMQDLCCGTNKLVFPDKKLYALKPLDGDCFVVQPKV